MVKELIRGFVELAKAAFDVESAPQMMCEAIGCGKPITDGKWLHITGHHYHLRCYNERLIKVALPVAASVASLLELNDQVNPIETRSVACWN